MPATTSSTTPNPRRFATFADRSALGFFSLSASDLRKNVSRRIVRHGFSGALRDTGSPQHCDASEEEH
jgi:hypothetical protein